MLWSCRAKEVLTKVTRSATEKADANRDDMQTDTQEPPSPNAIIFSCIKCLLSSQA